MLRRLRGQRSFTQWTERLAEVAHAEDISTTPSSLNGPFQSEPEIAVPISKPVPISLRLEGPYFTPADPAAYRTVVCLVAGTGVSGAIAICVAFKEMERQSAAMTQSGATLSPPRCTMGEPAPLQIQSLNGRAGSITFVQKDRVWTRCIVIWSVREEMHIDRPELKGPPLFPPHANDS